LIERLNAYVGSRFVPKQDPLQVHLEDLRRTPLRDVPTNDTDLGHRSTRLKTARSLKDLQHGLRASIGQGPIGPLNLSVDEYLLAQVIQYLKADLIVGDPEQVRQRPSCLRDGLSLDSDHSSFTQFNPSVHSNDPLATPGILTVDGYLDPIGAVQDVPIPCNGIRLRRLPQGYLQALPFCAHASGRQ
jgi:hypothetical protein